MIEGDKVYYTPLEAADYTGKGLATIKRHMKNENLVPIRLDGRTRVFTKAQLDEWVKNVGGKGRPRKPKETTDVTTD